MTINFDLPFFNRLYDYIIVIRLRISNETNITLSINNIHSVIEARTFHKQLNVCCCCCSFFISFVLRAGKIDEMMTPQQSEKKQSVRHLALVTRSFFSLLLLLLFIFPLFNSFSLQFINILFQSCGYFSSFSV